MRMGWGSFLFYVLVLTVAILACTFFIHSFIHSFVCVFVNYQHIRFFSNISKWARLLYQNLDDRPSHGRFSHQAVASTLG